MEFGLHIGVHGDRASCIREWEGKVGAVQLFAGNPRSFHPVGEPWVRYDGPLKVVIHQPYPINLADPTEEAWKGAQSLVRFANALGAFAVVFHAGSSKKESHSHGIAIYQDHLHQLLLLSGEVKLLVENASQGRPYGTNSSLGSIRTVFEIVRGFGPRVGMCLDIAHLWGSTDDMEPLLKFRPSPLIPVIHSNVANPNVARGSRLDLHGCGVHEGAYPLDLVAKFLAVLQPEVAILESDVATIDEVNEIKRLTVSSRIDRIISRI